MQRIHDPTDFKVGTVFVGEKNNSRKCEIVRFFHEKYINCAGKARYKKELTVFFRDVKTGKIFTTDIETLCRTKITILEVETK